LALADLIVARLLPAGAALTLAVDDTLFKRSGKKVFGVAWHHDGAAKGPKPIGFGNCWVVAGIVVQLSFSVSPGVSAGAGSVVAAPAHREDRARPAAGRVDRRPVSRPDGACGR
jgi:DDE superfamily endonuclease